ncbi:uncharacterized protein LOC126899914 isoform X2 [Daktulosphaira vitifoliae]|uniref:uncharacterized protein LOC126899914 isoform X2 n=1 Tax=Daktulosphaira vitifoliae TaxID=58002 RepID=UPI0021AA769B|nr:uncharacterized protein LOC126899914 isoform X2 [Daktulosphaira vitifoliae]
MYLILFLTLNFVLSEVLTISCFFCTICQSNISSKCITLDCGCKFHKKCIDRWEYTDDDPKCPNCQASLLKICKYCTSRKLWADSRFIYRTTCCDERICQYCYERCEKAVYCICRICETMNVKGVPVEISIRTLRCKICYDKPGCRSMSKDCRHLYCENCFQNIIKDQNCCLRKSCYGILEE